MALDTRDISLIKGMLVRGDRQSDIAAFFGCNSGRIAEVSTEKRGAEIKPASVGLPPSGPYMAARSAFKAKQTLEAIALLIEDALKEIDEWENGADE